MVAGIVAGGGTARNIEYCPRWPAAGRTLAAIAAIGTAGWVLLALAFGKSIDNMLDPRVVTNAVIAIVLVVFASRTFLHSGGRAE